jgi:hypothetical protein
MGFTEVYNLSGGILQWQGQTATGSPRQGLDFFLAGDFASGAAMAYTMEACVQAFYLEMAEESDQKANKETF